MAKKTNVLVVDDDEGIRVLVQRYLSRAGYAVAMAETAVAAARMLVGSTPDVVVMDVEMPEMDGIEFVRNMRTDTTVRKVPVILITAHERYSDEAAALGVECILKPFTAERLLEAIGRALPGARP